jgi:hypothetical protein
MQKQPILKGLKINRSKNPSQIAAEKTALTLSKNGVSHCDVFIPKRNFHMPICIIDDVFIRKMQIQ